MAASNVFQIIPSNIGTKSYHLPHLTCRWLPSMVPHSKCLNCHPGWCSRISGENLDD
jgi:hypothetical protein